MEWLIWLGGIAANLLSMGRFLDIAARDAYGAEITVHRSRISRGS